MRSWTQPTRHHFTSPPRARLPRWSTFLLTSKIDMDAVDDWQNTAVFRAVNKGYPPTLERFVERGADHTNRTSTSLTHFHPCSSFFSDF